MAYPERLEAAFADNDAYQQLQPGENGHPDDGAASPRFVLSTTAFDNEVSLQASNDCVRCTVTVTPPTLRAAAADEVGDTVSTDWRETLTRRLADAPKATRSQVELLDFGTQVLEEADEQRIEIRYVFERDDPATAADVAKTLIEYVEGTYAQGIIPGYEYIEPVSGLLSKASQGGEGGTPL